MYVYLMQNYKIWELPPKKMPLNVKKQPSAQVWKAVCMDGSHFLGTKLS